MCNISSLYINRGRAEGRAEGRVEGKAEGSLETTINHVIAMFKKNIPVQTIAEIVKLSVQETEKIIHENT